MTNAIETVDLKKSFNHAKNLKDFIMHPFKREDVLALDGINLQVKKGELFSIIGQNGAGKTTLIKLLCTLILPDAGQAIINGYDLVKESDQVKKSIGLVSSEERSFFWRLTAQENLKFFSFLHDMGNLEAEKRIDDVLKIVNLDDQADHRFDTFSTGMKSRLAIARGLLNDPEIIFFDEPTKSMDPYHAQELRGFIREELIKNQEKTVFLATHNLVEAERLSDRIAIINKGQIKACAPPVELKKILKKHEKYTIEYKNIKENILEELGKIEGVEEVVNFSSQGDSASMEILLSNTGTTLPLVMDLILGAGGKIRECKKEEPSLDEVFNFYQ